MFAARLCSLVMLYLQIILLHKDPTGENVFSERDTHNFSIGSDALQLSILTVPEVRAKIAQLQKHLAHLEKVTLF